MGQFIEVLNNQANLDDLNLNLESFQGGLDCNVDEVSIILILPINHLLLLIYTIFYSWCVVKKKFINQSFANVYH